MAVDKVKQNQLRIPLMIRTYNEIVKGITEKTGLKIPEAENLSDIPTPIMSMLACYEHNSLCLPFIRADLAKTRKDGKSTLSVEQICDRYEVSTSVVRRIGSEIGRCPHPMAKWQKQKINRNIDNVKQADNDQ